MDENIDSEPDSPPRPLSPRLVPKKLKPRASPKRYTIRNPKSIGMLFEQQDQALDTQPGYFLNEEHIKESKDRSESIFRNNKKDKDSGPFVRSKDDFVTGVAMTDRGYVIEDMDDPINDGINQWQPNSRRELKIKKP